MLVPGLLFLILMNYLPMFGSLIAFKDINYELGIFGSPWVGLKNFIFMFSSADAWIAIRNTLLYNAVFIFTGPLISVALAIALNEVRSRAASRIYQTLSIMPFFVSFVVVSYFVYAFLGSPNGYVNTQLAPLLGFDPVSWYTKPENWPAILFIVNGWKGWGIGTVIYLATMAGFDSELYEAATIDGASRWRQITAITLPLLMPIITILFILSLGNIFRSDFGLFWQVPRGSGILSPATNTLDTYVYRALLVTRDMGMASAAALVQSVVGFITILGANLFIRKVAPDRALF
jgi:putative aldouronate transport system permease protein